MIQLKMKKKCNNYNKKIGKMIADWNLQDSWNKRKSQVLHNFNDSHAF